MRFGRLAPVVLVLALAPCRASFAQSEGRFAIGGQFISRVPNDGTTVHGSRGPGLLWRFGHADTGWGWHWGLNWFSTDIDRPVGGRDAELGELRIRPLMGGYGYTRVIGRTTLTADVLGGYALTNITMAPSTSDVYRDRLGARAVSVDAGNSLVAKPELGIWFDVNKKVGINVNAGYVVTRPNVTVRSTLGEDTRRVRADMFVIQVGAVYSIF